MIAQESRLATASTRVGRTAKDILSWIDESDDLVPAERDALLHEAYRTATAADRLTRSLDEGPCVAFVGPRRSGKTQLLSSLIDQSGSISIAFDGVREHINFAKQITPEGGKNGSAAILRLSAKARRTAHKLPLAVRVISIADLIKVIGCAFFKNMAAGRGHLPDPAQLKALMQAALDGVGTVAEPGLSEPEIWDIQHYFGTHFGEEPIVRALLKAGYWETLADVASLLPNARRGQLLSVLWGGLAPLTGLFVSLADSIGSLGAGDDVSCALDAILAVDTRTGRLQRRADNIVGAQAVHGIGQTDDDTVMVSNSNTLWKSITRRNLSAIVAEVRLPVTGSPSELLAQADVLEFPTIEGNTHIGDLEEMLARDPGHLSEIYLRAKAFYLLERYIEDHAITSMVVCIDPANTQVGELADLVATWIEKSHGPEPAIREQQATGLFVCFTKLDREFAEPARRTKERRTDWGAHITKTLHKGFGQHESWPTEWSTNRAFDNVHLLRNPNTKAKHLCNYGNDGREMGYKAGQKERIDRAKKDFVASQDVRRHLVDPVAIWDEAFQLNDGGTTFLAQSIAEVCGGNVKRRQIAGNLNQLASALHGRMQAYHVSSDTAFQADRRQVSALMITRQLRRCAERRRFGHLIRSLQLLDSDFQDALLRVAPGAALEPPAARTYADAAFTHWIATVEMLAQSRQFSQKLGVSRDTLQQLVSELVGGAVRLNLEDRMAKQIEDILAPDASEAERVVQAAACAASTMGEYVMWLGFNDVLSNSHPRRKGRSQTPIFPPRASTDVWSDDAATEELDRRFLSDWSQAFQAIVEGNAGQLQERAIDPDRNGRLSTLLDQLSIRL